jgi:hypothetical protein
MMLTVIAEKVRKTSKKRERSNSAKRGVMGNKHAAKADKKIKIGWLMFDDVEQTYKQVKSPKGGGTRVER